MREDARSRAPGPRRRARAVPRRAGLGIALVPRLGRGGLPPEVAPLRLDPAPTRRLHALWRAGAARRPAIREAVRTLQELWPSIASAA